MPFEGPEGQEFEDFDDCVETIQGDGTSEEEAKRICGKWESENENYVRVNAVSPDPTQSKTLRNNFGRDFRSRWRSLRGENRDFIQDLSLESDESHLLMNYRQWFDTTASAMVVEPTQLSNVKRGHHWTGTYVRQAYQKGLRLAERDLKRANYDGDRAASVTSETVKEHRDHRQREYLTAFHETQDAVVTMRKHLTRVMKDGLQNRTGFRQIADDANTVVKKKGRNATNALANTVVVETVNEALITSFELLGVEHVGVQVESVGTAEVRENYAPGRMRLNEEGEVVWETAKDRKVCPDCMALEGAVIPVSEIRGRDEFQPPIHPNCRCKLVPMPADG